MKHSLKWGFELLLSAFSLTVQAQNTSLVQLPTVKSSSFAAPEESITIIAWTQIKAGSEEKIAEATQIMTDKIRKLEPGNLIFEVHQGATAPGIIIFYEVFKDEAAFKNHQNAQHVKDWFKAIEGLTTAPMNVNLVNNFDTYKEIKY